MYIYYISLIPVICNRKLAKKKTEASISPISFRFTEQRSVEITYLFLSFMPTELRCRSQFQ